MVLRPIAFAIWMRCRQYSAECARVHLAGADLERLAVEQEVGGREREGVARGGGRCARAAGAVRDRGVTCACATGRAASVKSAAAAIDAWHECAGRRAAVKRGVGGRRAAA